MEVLSAKNEGVIDDSEAESCYAFVNISVGIWRDMTEKDAEEMIADSKERGDYEDDRASLEEELEKSRNYWTVGIGKAGCYKGN